MTPEPWQLDWNIFVTVLEQKLQAGESDSAISQFFGGKTVRWTGVLEMIEMDDLLSYAFIDLPLREINVGDGHTEILDGISLPLDDDALDAWETIAVGDPASFSARFLAADSVSGPIQVKCIEGGKRSLSLD